MQSVINSNLISMPTPILDVIPPSAMLTVSHAPQLTKLMNMPDLSSSFGDEDNPLITSGDCMYSTEDNVIQLLLRNAESSVTIMHLNCRSTAKNWNSMLMLFEKFKQPVTAIAITETWLTDSTAPLYNMNGYKLVTNSRKGKRWGWVCVFCLR
jgi:hypothetical protein